MGHDLIDRYYDILEPVFRWKVLPLKSLYDEVYDHVQYRSFKKLIQRLEKKELLKTKYFDNPPQKLVYLLPDVYKYFREKDYPVIDSTTLGHDAIAASLASKFSKLDYVNSVEMAHEFSNSQNWNKAKMLDPDVVLYIEKKRKYTVAVEIELSKKCISRLREKFLRYKSSDYYDFVIYITNNEEVLRSCLKRLNELVKEKVVPKKEILDSVMIGFNEDITRSQFKLDHLEIYYREKRVSFDKIF